jgi:SAM-dependent methyltransferase
MMCPHGAFALPTVLLCMAVSGTAFGQSSKVPRNNLAPYVHSPQNVVERMLEVAQVKPGETVYDLGSGDGRVLIAAAQRFQARGVGIELSERAAKASVQRSKELQLDQQIRIVHGNLLEADLSEADVVTIYLLTKSNDMLRPNLEKYLKVGARVVSHDFEIPGWEAARVEEVEAHKRIHKLFLYEVGKQLPAAR